MLALIDIVTGYFVIVMVGLLLLNDTKAFYELPIIYQLCVVLNIVMGVLLIVNAGHLWELM